MKENNRDIIAIILPALLLIGIFILSFFRFVRRISFWTELDLILIILYIVWISIESVISKRDYKTEGKQTFDSGTSLLYSFGQALTFFTALWFPSLWYYHAGIHIAGFIVFLSGVLFRLWSVRTLGKYYSHRVRRIEQHKIIDNGPYNLLRHPAYAGMIAANLGIVIYFFNWITLCVFTVILVPAIILRISVEEKMLFNIEGYSDFAKERKRLIPGIW